MKNLKIKAEFDYGSMTFTIIGLVSKEDWNDTIKRGNEVWGIKGDWIPPVGYIEDGDMQTDAEGVNIHTILEGQAEYDAYCLLHEVNECGDVTTTVLGDGEDTKDEGSPEGNYSGDHDFVNEMDNAKEVAEVLSKEFDVELDEDNLDEEGLGGAIASDQEILEVLISVLYPDYELHVNEYRDDVDFDIKKKGGANIV